MLVCLAIIFGLGTFIFGVCSIQYHNKSSSYKEELERKGILSKDPKDEERNNAILKEIQNKRSATAQAFEMGALVCFICNIICLYFV